MSLPALPPNSPTELEQAREVMRLQQLRIDELEKKAARVDELEAQVEELSRQLAELLDKQGSTSRNSSKPPSSDSPEQRSQRPKRKPGSRNRGGQPGHTRHQRALYPPEQVNQVEQYFPESRCDCGGEVVIDWDSPYRHQIFDIPPPEIDVTEHQFYHGTCTCCQRHHASQWPDWVPTGQMGAGLIGWIVIFSGQFRLSIRQIQSLLLELWRLPFSTGAISNAQGKATPWLGELSRQVGEYIRQQPVAHADETRHYRGSQTYWLWALTSGPLTYFMTHYSRGKQAAAQLLGSFKGYLVTDHFSGYTGVPAERRQLCWAHLIRHFRKIAARRGEAGKTGQRLLLIALCIFRTRHHYQHHPDQQQRYQRRMQRLRRSFQATLRRGGELDEATCKRTHNQCLHLLKDEGMCRTFLKDDRIPLTNNLAERVIRPYVLWRKTSLATQSARGDQFRPVALTVLGTARQLGMGLGEMMRDICAAGLMNKTIPVRFQFDDKTS